MKQISYGSDQTADYAAELTAVKNLKDLKNVVYAYRKIAKDACDVVDVMTHEDFKEFRTMLNKERRRKFSGKEAVEKYGSIILPEIMFRVAMVANRYHAPWGLAYIRCKEVGLLQEKQGIAVWNGPREENTKAGEDHPNGG
jgi:hypothetical protein